MAKLISDDYKSFEDIRRVRDDDTYGKEAFAERDIAELLGASRTTIGFQLSA